MLQSVGCKACQLSKASLATTVGGVGQDCPDAVPPSVRAWRRQQYPVLAASGVGCVFDDSQWAERLVEGRGNESWGENWVEDFGSGKVRSCLPISEHASV